MDGETADILGWSFVVAPLGETSSVDLPCVYLIAHLDTESPASFRILYAGQTSCLARRFVGHHQMAAAVGLGATHVLALWVEDANVRLNLEALLRYHFRPPLNAEEVPSHAEGWGAATFCGRPELAQQARAAHLRGDRRMGGPGVAQAVPSRRD